MARVPRRLAGIGASDLENASEFDSYIGPARELTVDPIRGILALHDGATAGGKRFPSADASTSASGLMSAADKTKLNQISVWPGVFDGITDNTAAFTAFINQINAGNIKTILIPTGIGISGLLPAITANDVTFIWSGQLKLKANSIPVGGGVFFRLTGNRSRHIGLIDIDGNKAAFTPTPPPCYLFDFSGDGHMFMGGLKICNSPYMGIHADGATNFWVQGLVADDNSNLGFEFVRVAHGTIYTRSVSRNGYGFGKTRTSPADASHLFEAFGGAVRYRSHDLTFIGGKFNDNGRDGLCINQGSYNIKHIGCQADGNDDGGFTAANDPGTLPGADERCYNISYIDCGAENNWGSGIVNYSDGHGYVIKGGTVKNNHRGAGDIIGAAAHPNGIFIPGLGSGSNIDAEAYDDRQQRAIQSRGSVANLPDGTPYVTLNAAGWVPGLMLKYPKVGIWNAANVFIGWGKIVAEAAGQVSIKTLPYDGVNLANITGGMIVSQAVQLTGTAIGNIASGSVNVRGTKNRPGPWGSGQMLSIGNSVSGGKMIIENAIAGKNLITNGDFDTDLTGWNFDLTGGGVATRDTAIAKSAASLKLVAGTQQVYGEPVLAAGAINYIKNSFWRFRGWIYCTVDGGAEVWAATKNVEGPQGPALFRADRSGWQPFHLSGSYESVDTTLFLRVVANPGATVYFDALFFEPLEIPIWFPVTSREW